MGCGVSTLIRGHISVRLRHYIILVNNISLLPLPLLQLIRPPPLIPELYTLLFPSLQGLKVAWPLLLHQFQAKYWSRGNLLCHTSVAAVYVLPNILQPRLFQRPLVVLAPIHPARTPPRCLMMYDP